MHLEPPKSTTTETGTVELEKQHLIQSYGRYALQIKKGKGVYVFDPAGKRYLDFVSGIGVNALGHGHPRLMKAMREQMSKLIHCSNLYYHDFQAPLAARLAEASGLNRVFFSNSGAEAAEGALKIAKGYGRRVRPEKYEIVALNNGFAGRTLGAISITGTAKYREPFEPLIPGVRFIDPNDLDALRNTVNGNTAAVIVEPILGEGGLTQISREFAVEARRLTSEHDAILIFDEIQCGLGRTGTYFAFQNWNRPSPELPHPEPLHPDIVIAAKPLGGGLPLGCILANERAASVITPGMHGSTFGGNALTCRLAIEFLDVLEEMLPEIKEVGAYFERHLKELELKHDIVKSVRGRGLMRGLELAVPCKWVVPAAQEEGVLINCTAENVIRFLPPYIIERKHIDKLVEVLDKVIQAGPPEA